MDNKSAGLLEDGKYWVNRKDGTDVTGEKHCGCDYFVLDITHDRHAIPALYAYADSAEEDGYEALARDLRTKAGIAVGYWVHADEADAMLEARAKDEGE